MININDYEDLKIGDEFFYYIEPWEKLNMEADIVICKIININSYNDQKSSIAIYYTSKYTEISYFYLNSNLSQKCFMYFRDKNIKTLLDENL